MPAGIGYCEDLVNFSIFEFLARFVTQNFKNLVKFLLFIRADKICQLKYVCLVRNRISEFLTRLERTIFCKYFNDRNIFYKQIINMHKNNGPGLFRVQKQRDKSCQVCLTMLSGSEIKSTTEKGDVRNELPFLHSPFFPVPRLKNLRSCSVPLPRLPSLPSGTRYRRPCRSCSLCG